MSIRRGCDGIVATILLVSACLAYPLSWKRRLSGVLLGYLLIFSLNLIRIVGLFVAGLKGSAQTFGIVHTYVSQFVVIALAMVFLDLLGWKRANRPHLGDCSSSSCSARSFTGRWGLFSAHWRRPTKKCCSQVLLRSTRPRERH